MKTLVVPVPNHNSKERIRKYSNSFYCFVFGSLFYLTGLSYVLLILTRFAIRFFVSCISLSKDADPSDRMTSPQLSCTIFTSCQFMRHTHPLVTVFDSRCVE